VKAEKEKRLQQLPPEAQGLIADPSRMRLGKKKETGEYKSDSHKDSVDSKNYKE